MLKSSRACTFKIYIMSAHISSVFFISILMLFHTSCSSDKADHVDHGSIALAKVDSVVLGNSEPLFGKFVEQFRVNDVGDSWIFSERNQDRIFAFDNQGQFINVLGERGKGPKGIVRVSSFAINSNNEVIINDAAQRMLKVFDLTGELIHSNTFLNDGRLFAHPYRLYVYEDRLLIPVTEMKHTHEPHKSRLLALVKYDGTIDIVFGYQDPFSEEDNNYSTYNNILIEGETIFTSLSTSPYVQAYDINTYQKVGYFGEPSTSFAIPEKEIHARLPIPEINKRATNSSAMTGFYSTEHHIVLHMQILTAEFFETIDFSKKENILVVYDKETKEFIKEIPVPHTLGAVHNNNLYFIEDFNPDNYTIGIYELTNEE